MADWSGNVQRVSTCVNVTFKVRICGLRVIGAQVSVNYLHWFILETLIALRQNN